eukprot:TRINITY_DN4860_c0_g2_i2.p1 TRINITY_DN4860_c0_g2~~TRINITY_DN4860_c0_g2_i2.p1  ORF type:complete len:157 (-),score=24.00 TRINITY_DN4860_c0_g2_i2:540-1010(-)
MTYGYSLETHSEVGFYRECLSHEKRFSRVGMANSMRFLSHENPPPPIPSPTKRAEEPIRGFHTPRYVYTDVDKRDVAPLPPLSTYVRDSSQTANKNTMRLFEPRQQQIHPGTKLSPIKGRHAIHSKLTSQSPQSPSAPSSARHASPRVSLRNAHLS